MNSVREFLNEAADSGKNLHLTHVDEDLFERGDKGARAAIESCRNIVNGLGTGETKLTLKWDGAPAIFAGIDPDDGKFFVSTKGAFNKTPLLYKGPADKSKFATGDKLAIAHKEFQKIGIPKGVVIQGDLLFTKGEQKYETIDGKRFITVHPNTIVYAWEANSEVGTNIRNADIGVVWHTTYSGKTLQSMRAKFGVNVKRLKQTRSVWMDDAYFKGANVAFTESEKSKVEGLIALAEQQIGGFDKLKAIMDMIPSTAVGAGIKTYINSNIRKGRLPTAQKNPVKDYIEYVDTYYQEKVVSKVKTDAAKETKLAAKSQLRSDLGKNADILKKAFQFVDYITQAKVLIIKKLVSLDKQKQFIKTSKGFKVSNPEGFVAINAKKGEAVKFVDRLEFSYNNFSDDVMKGWQK
tara:strand:- start:7245 stop:8468 length:1224 start_codon:yes stop_codon:yes gene_type:complete